MPAPTTDLPLASDLTATEFKNVTVPFAELWRAAAMGRSAAQALTGRTFRNCIILGPGIFFPLGGCELDACELGNARGDMKNILWRPLSDRFVTGAIPLIDCKFHECTFIAVGFSGPENFVNELQTIPVPPPIAPIY